MKAAEARKLANIKAELNKLEGLYGAIKHAATNGEYELIHKKELSIACLDILAKDGYVIETIRDENEDYHRSNYVFLHHKISWRQA